eukprot:gene8159-9032_t
MSECQKRVFATPGSRSFHTPNSSLLSRPSHTGASTCQNKSDEGKTTERLLAIKTPQNKNKKMDNSSTFGSRGISPFLTTPDSSDSEYSGSNLSMFSTTRRNKSFSLCNNEEKSSGNNSFRSEIKSTTTSSSTETPTLRSEAISRVSPSPSTLSASSTQRPFNVQPRKRPLETSTISPESTDNQTSVISEQNVANVPLFFEEDINDIKTYMSVVKGAGKIGLAHYDTDKCVVHMMEDVIETEDQHYLKLAKKTIKPNVIITSAKQDQSFLQALRQEDEDTSTHLEKQVTIDVIPCMMFGYEICKRRILNLNGLPGLSDESTDDERNIFIGSLLSFDNTNMVRATGALLKYLDKNRVGVELEDPGTNVPILALKSFSLSSVMKIDDSTYGALQIFGKEAHPSVYKSGGSGAKEGLSLFGMMNYTKSSPGSKLLNQWFLHPLTSIDEIRRRHDSISFFLNARNLEAVMTFQENLKHVKNVNRILSKMLSTGVSVADWKNLYKAIYNAICIGDVCKGLPQTIDIIKKIDFDESTSSQRFTVKPGVDNELDERKRTYNGLPDLMTKVASEELKNLDESIIECGVSYLPQLGYLLTIPLTEKMKTDQQFNLEGLEFVFVSDDIVHYKTVATRELDQLLGDTQSLIFDHETAIMYRLQNVIIENSQLLLSVVELCSELDCFLAFATASREGNYCRPELVENSVLSIKGCRHPIQELCTNQFVPNDVDVEIDKSRIKVITSPNASGKSIYLKQIGLVVFLAQIGCFVPAESAVIGLCDRLFTRIHAKETVSTPLSTFMIDLNQISNAVHNATDKSLILVDEFGKGTAANDGLALLAAVLRHWLSQERACPRVFVSTHFHGLIRYKLLPESNLIHYQAVPGGIFDCSKKLSFLADFDCKKKIWFEKERFRFEKKDLMIDCEYFLQTMEVMEEDGDLVFLYHLKDGHADSSHALSVAKSVGMDKEIMKRAEEVSRLIAENKEVRRINSLDSETQHQRFTAIVERFLDLDLEEDDVCSFLENCIQTMNEP